MALTRPRAAQIYDIDYKQATRVVTVANINISGGAPNQVDGVNLSLKDRILVTGQSTASQNGIYYVTTLGSGSNGTWSRSLDTNETGEILTGTIVMVTEGVIYADTQWKLITDGVITVDVTDQDWTQNYSANSISSGNSNVVVGANANVTISSNGTANVLLISSTGAVVTGTLSATGNTIVANLNTGGMVSATGNVDADYLNANIYYATGFSASRIFSGNSEVNVTSAGGNVNVSVGGTSNVALFTSAGEYVTGLLSATGNATAGNVLTGGLISATGNVVAGNVTTVGEVSATGNVTGNYFLGNVACASGIFATKIFSGTTEANIVAANGNLAITVDGTSNVAVFATTGEYVTGLVSVSGNVTGGNVLTAGLVSATGNISGNYILGNGSAISNVYVFSNIGITGQNTINASSIASTLTFTAGNNIVLTGNTTTNTIIIDYSSSGGSSIFATGGDMGLVTEVVTSSEDLGNVTSVATTSYDLGQLGVDGVVSNSDIIANTITGDKINSATSISITGNLTAANLALTSSSSDVRGWWYSGNSVSVSSQEATPTGVSLDAVIGTKMYVVGTTNRTVYQYTLSTAFNASTASYANLSFSVASQDTSPQDIKFNNAGSAMYVLGGANAKVFQYSISAGDVSTASYGNLSLAVNSQELTPTGLAVSADGANLYVVGTTAKTIYQYTLGTAGNVATGSFAAHSLSVVAQDTAPAGLAFSTDGTICWMIGATNKHVYQYNLSDPYNIDSGVYASKVYVGDQEAIPTSLYLNQTAGYAYVTGSTPASVFQYGINNATVATANALYLSVSTAYLGGNLYTQGNVTSGNLLTVGIMSATGNATGGNILTVGIVSATGNATGGNILTGGIVSATGNVTGGNILTGGIVSATGNVTGGNLNLSGNIVDTGALWINTLANGNITLNANGTGQTLVSTGLSVAGNITSRAILETATITATAPPAPTNFDIVTQAVQYYTANANANVTLNFRGNATITANTLLAVGQSTTVALLWTNGASAFYPNVIQVDSANVTPKWQGGTAVTAGSANAIDVYSFTIIKTAATPTYVVLGSQTKFA